MCQALWKELRAPVQPLTPGGGSQTVCQDSVTQNGQIIETWLSQMTAYFV